MKRKSFFLWSMLAAALTVTSCSNNEVEAPEGETGNFKFELAFSQENAVSRAPNRPIPETSWDNIESIQFFLYDNTGKFIFSKQEDPSTKVGDTKVYNYANIPVGTNYTLVVTANTNSSTQPISTYADGGTTAAEWTDFGVRQKNISQMVLKHKKGTFASFATFENFTGKAAFEEPAEIFMASQDGIAINQGVDTPVGTLNLKREVSMMRVRINDKDGEYTNNEHDTPAGIDMTKNSSILIYRIPNNMKIAHGNDGGASSASTENNIISISNASASVFTKGDPTSGYAQLI